MSRLKVDDLSWEMPAHDDEPPSLRRLRLWETSRGDLLAVITEAGDGTAVTDVAARAYTAVRAKFPHARVFEHYPEFRDEAETLDEITVLDGLPSWTRVRPQDIDRDWLPLED
ncbi:MAG: hypothetical protein L0K86_02945 [Actinomycetia bacterium]|nr:hypothetical protein [Actinomycetes bacterium]